MNAYTHPADVPSVAPMRVQLDAARAIRAADFFDQARAAHDDVAAGETLSPTSTVLAERFRLVDGCSESAPERARIIGTYGLGYLVRFLSDGAEALAFPSEIAPLR